MRRICIGLVISTCALTAPAFADEQCDGSCPNVDEVMVSFADGNNLSCSCVKAGSPMNDDTAEFDPMNPPPNGPSDEQQS